MLFVLYTKSGALPLALTGALPDALPA